MFNRKAFTSYIIPLIALVSLFVYVSYKNNLVDKETSNKYTTEKGLDFTLEYPLPNAEVPCEFEIEGEISSSWFFEGSFLVKIYVGNKVVHESVAYSEEDWLKDGTISFYSDIDCKEGCVGEGKIVLEKDNPSGLEENSDRYEIPVTFNSVCGVSLETTVVKVYLGNTNEDPESLNCEITYPVERKIPKTLGVGKAAIEELLSGAKESESIQGYYSSIPSNVELNSLRITDGVAYADFNSALQDGVGGSCLTSRIRSQIENTLLQFESVNSVVISVDGQKENVLQP